jgi:hypothetical protein
MGAEWSAATFRLDSAIIPSLTGNSVLNNLCTISGYKYNLVNPINNYGLIVGFFATDTDRRGYLRVSNTPGR